MQYLLQVLVWGLELGPRRPQTPLTAWAQQSHLQQMLQHSLSSLMTGCGPQRAGRGTWQPTVLFCVSLGCRLMLMTGSTCSPEAGRAVALTCLALGWQFQLPTLCVQVTDHLRPGGSLALLAGLFYPRTVVNYLLAPLSATA